MFDSSTGSQICELLRGYATYASIKCMSFNVSAVLQQGLTGPLTAMQGDASMLLASSDKQTVHIFKLSAADQAAAQPATEAAPSQQSYLGWLGGAVMSAASNLVPSAVSGFWTQCAIGKLRL